MEISIFNFIKDAVTAVRAGNQYRAEKYGEPETMYKSYMKARAHIKWQKENIQPNALPFFISKQQCMEIDRLKLQYQYWDCWTGGRFAREENPYINENYFNKNHKKHSNLVNVEYKHFIKHVKMNSVIRSNPVTGHWHPHEEFLDK